MVESPARRVQSLRVVDHHPVEDPQLRVWPQQGSINPACARPDGIRDFEFFLEKAEGAKLCRVPNFSASSVPSLMTLLDSDFLNFVPTYYDLVLMTTWIRNVRQE